MISFHELSNLYKEIVIRNHWRWKINRL